MRKLWIAFAVMTMASVVFAASMEMTSARLYWKQSEYLKALQFYDTAIQKEPSNLDAFFERGQVLGEIAMDSSKAEIQKAASNNAPDPQHALLEKMKADFDKVAGTPDNKDAKKMSKKMDDLVNRYWGTFYSGAAKSDTLASKFANDTSLDSTKRATQVAQARDRALQKVDLALLMKPKEWRTFALQAQIYEHMDQQSKALEAWEKARTAIDQSGLAKDNPNDYRKFIDVINARLLDGYYSAGQCEQVIKFANEMIKANPSDLSAARYKAFCLAQMAVDTATNAARRDSLRGAAVQALNVLTSDTALARKAPGEYANILFTIGQIYLQMADTAHALTFFQNYLALAPEDSAVEFVVGVIYLEGGSFLDNKKAQATFKKITDAHPAYGAAWINYGIATIREGDNANGKKYIEKGKSLAGK